MKCLTCWLVALLALIETVTAGAADAPAWWATSGVVVTNDLNNPTDNWAMANVGQLKNMATQAKVHLDGTLNLTADDWDTAYGGAANNPLPFASGSSDPLDPKGNYAALTIGQLKFIASGFYRILKTKAPNYSVPARLTAVGAAQSTMTFSDLPGVLVDVPWSAAITGDPDNKAAVTIGQLKVVFSFDLGSSTSTTPSFTTHPVSQTVNAGANVTFTAAANGNPVPTYQWYKGGTLISGATSAAFTLNGVQAANAGSYTVVATNSVASVTSNAATLTVNASNPDADPDNDGLTNAQEQQLGTNPNDPDSDDDLILDGAEFLLGTNPNVARQNDSANQLMLKIHQPSS